MTKARRFRAAWTALGTWPPITSRASGHSATRAAALCGNAACDAIAQPQTALHRGAKGSIINHAEHKVELDHVRSLFEMLPEGFPVCACAADVEEAKALAALNPTYIAVEPPELIGGDISVTTADPAIVSDTVAAVKAVNPNVRVLCGAGVKNGQDVAKALELGAEGVLLASGVTKASDVHAVLADLVGSL